jgi:hypothetical protein
MSLTDSESGANPPPSFKGLSLVYLLSRPNLMVRYSRKRAAVSLAMSGKVT